MAYTKYDYNTLGYVMFGNKHSYKDYGLVLASYKVEPPKRKTFGFESNFTDGKVDYTSKVHSSPIYGNRKIELTFKIFDKIIYGNEWFDFKNKICTDLNGKTFTDEIFISFESAYYSGIVFVNSLGIDRLTGTVTMTVDAQPYCRKMIEIEDVQKFEKDPDATGSYVYRGTITIPAGVKSALEVGGLLFIKTSSSSYATVDAWTSKTTRTYISANSLVSFGEITSASSAAKNILFEFSTSTSKTITYRVLGAKKYV